MPRYDLIHQIASATGLCRDFVFTVWRLSLDIVLLLPALSQAARAWHRAGRCATMRPEGGCSPRGQAPPRGKGAAPSNRGVAPIWTWLRMKCTSCLWSASRGRATPRFVPCLRQPWSSSSDSSNVFLDPNLCLFECVCAHGWFHCTCEISKCARLNYKR